jgi:hypothetical protein
MQIFSRCLTGLAALTLVATTAAPVHAQASNLKLSMANGRVTLIATEVPLQLLLAEWARIGGTRIVNGEKLVGPPVTLELVDYPEGRALDLVLRPAAGYMAAPRPVGEPGVSLYDRILILPTSKPPAVNASAAAPPQPFTRNVMPQPMPAPVDDQDDPIDQGPVPPPGMVPQGMPTPGMPTPGNPNAQPQPYPVGAPQQQPVLTAPRPGQLPMPQPQQPPPGINPYAPPPGAVRPPQLPNRPGGGSDQ